MTHPPPYTYLSYAVISAVVNLPLCRVRAVCEEFLRQGRVSQAVRRKGQVELTEEQLRFLLGKQELVQLRHHSLRARVQLFRQRFPGCKLTYNRLRLLYRQHGVSYRVLKPGILLS